MYAEQSSNEVREVSGKEAATIEPFGHALSIHGLTLDRGQTTTLQVNMGFLCNQTCRHCHLSAGPNRKENMTAQTVDEVVSYAWRSHFETIDITGGAPELNPNLANLIERLSPLAPRIMLRSNLTALNETTKDHAMDLLKEHRVVLIASLPSTNESQTDFQRGRSAFRTSISTLKKLNAMGYKISRNQAEEMAYIIRDKTVSLKRALFDSEIIDTYKSYISKSKTKDNKAKDNKASVKGGK